MGLNSQSQITAKFVLAEKGIPPRAIADFEKEPNTSFPEEGEGPFEGMYVYEGTERFAAHMVLHGGKVTFDNEGKYTFVPKRYYLIGTKTLDAEYRSPRGAIVWIRLEPYACVRKDVPVIDESGRQKVEKGQTIMGKVAVWEKLPKKK